MATASTDQPLAFGRYGAELNPGALGTADLSTLERAIGEVPSGRPGTRLPGSEMLRVLLDAAGPIGRVAARSLGADCRPVRAVLFDKRPGANWALGWHQDRTVVVRERREVPGFNNWSVKAGLLHVEPPWEVLAGMATLRVHLDPVPADNAPLLVAPGSHRLGRVPEGEAAAAVARLGCVACLAEVGDVWLYATPILHASARATGGGGRRRVLQVDYAADQLPGGLEWLGV